MSVYERGGITGAQAAALSRPGTAAGRFVALTPNGAGANGSPSAAAGRLTIYPAFVSHANPVVSLSIETVTGGAGSSVKIGIWANDPAIGLPRGLPLIAINTPIDTSVAEIDTVAVTPTALPVGQWVWVLNNWTGTAPTVTRAGTALGIMAALTAASGAGAALFSTEAFATDISTLDLTGRSWTGTGNNAMLVTAGY